MLLRPPDASDALVDAIVDLGGIPVPVPLSEFVAEPGVVDAIRAELARVPDYLVFTSARGVRAAAPALGGLTPATDLAAVGPATAEALEALGLPSPFVPPSSTAASLAAALPPKGSNRVLAPLAELAGSDLEQGLTDRGFSVVTLVAYRLRPLEPDPLRWQIARTADAVVFTAPSVVDRYVAVGGRPRPLLVSIGPRTTARLAATGWDGIVEASTHDGDGIVDALVASLDPDS